jgi:CheY-like chemotaxis protein
MSDTSSSGAAPLAGKRILAVEDEFIILLDIQGILEAAGAAAVITADGLDDALKVVAEQADRLDAAVLDLKLDKDSSAPIAQRLAAANVPFVFLTGSPADESIAKEHGAAPIIGKPFDSEVLLTALQQAMADRR